MPFILHIISYTALSIPLSLGYTFLFGRGRILHFGPVGVSLIAAYGAFLTQISTGSFLWALLAGAAAASAASLLFAWLSLRLEPDGLGILSIAMHLIILNIILNWQSVTRGALGLPNLPRLGFLETPAAFAFWMSVIAAGWIALFLWLERTPLARQLSALGEQEWHAKSLGISRFKVHMFAFLILGLCAANDSFFYPQLVHLLYPIDYNFPAFVLVLMIVVAGKPGSIRGAVAATILLNILKEALRFVPLEPSLLGPVRLILFGAILLAAVWWRRDSLFPHRRTI